MEPEQSNFDDPNLRAAARAAWAADRAPEALQKKLREIVRDPALFAGPAGHIAPRRSSWLRFAVAASILLLIGGVGYRIIELSSSRRATLLVALARNMVVTHDQCCALADHHMPGIPRDNFGLIASDMHARLGWPVLAAAITEPGWRFNGASVCPVGSLDSAHLVYKHPADGEAISVFSLPRSVVPPDEQNGAYAMVEAGHPMAGFITAAGLYCVVGSSRNGELTVDQIKQIRDELKPALSAASASRVTVASDR